VEPVEVLLVSCCPHPLENPSITGRQHSAIMNPVSPTQERVLVLLTDHIAHVNDHDQWRQAASHVYDVERKTGSREYKTACGATAIAQQETPSCWTLLSYQTVSLVLCRIQTKKHLQP
jgi:hypothetical protein